MKPTAPKTKKRPTSPKRSAAGKGRSKQPGRATTAGKASAPGSSSAPSVAPSATSSTSASSASEKRKVGRPTIRSPQLAALICERLASGESLRAICSGPNAPCTKITVLEWLRDDADFAAQYARAREEQADVLADEIVALADESIGCSAAEVQGYRLAVDARKWVAAKLKPKKYGDRVDVEHGGAVSHRIEKIERVIVDPANPDGPGI